MAWTTGAGVANSLLAAVTALVVTPLLVDALGPVRFGRWAGVNDLVAWALAADVGLTSYVVQRAAALDAAGDRAGARALTAAAQRFTVVVGSLIGIALCVALRQYTRLAGATEDQLAVVGAVGVAAGVASAWYAVAFAYGRGVQRTGPFAAGSTAAATAALVATVAGLLAGWGLWALAAGYAARTAVLVGTARWWIARSAADGAWRPSAEARAEVRRAAPETAGLSAAWAVSANCEALLLVPIAGPAAAAGYVVARRAPDLVRSFAESVSQGWYGAFAGAAAGAGDTAATLRRAAALRWAVSVAGATAVGAGNGAFVRWWVPDVTPPSWALSAALAIAAVVSSQAYFLNLSLRATGAHRSGTRLLAGEAVAKVAVVAITAAVAPLWAVAAVVTTIAAGSLFAHARALGRALAAPGAVGVPSPLAALTGVAVPIAAAWLAGRGGAP
jgi:hypothetical protein